MRGGHGLVTSLLSPYDFLIDPLPNLLFTRDSSVWVRDRVAITSLAMPARKRETQLTELIYTEHPRFAGRTHKIHGWHNEHVEGGDVLLLAPGVIAVGVGERTTPAGVERLARQVFHADLAHTVLAVPIAQERATMHLDTVCTMVDVDKVVMYPNVAHTLTAHAVTVRDAGPADTDLVLDVAEAEPFLVAAAKAMQIDTLHQIDTGLDPVTAEREQWDDGNNTLALAPRVAVAYERNDETNDRLEEAGIEVIRIAGSELGSGRGGPRCMSCPVERRAAHRRLTPATHIFGAIRSLGRAHRRARGTTHDVFHLRRALPRRGRAGQVRRHRRSRCPQGWSPIGERTPADKAYILTAGEVSVRRNGAEIATAGRRPDHRRGRDRQPHAALRQRSSR